MRQFLIVTMTVILITSILMVIISNLIPLGKKCLKENKYVIYTKKWRRRLKESVESMKLKLE